MKKISFFIVFVFLCTIISCKKDSVQTDDTVPIVFVHGLIGSGDSYEWMAKRFISNGYPQDKMFAFDWNTLPPGAENNIDGLKEFIDDVLRKTGASKVNLVGHSLGGALSFNYCKIPANAVNVAHLALIAPYLVDRSGVPSADVPTVNIWPNTDYVVTDGDSLPGAINVMLIDKDHNEAVACNETFQAIYNLFTGSDPSTLTVKEESEPLLSGRAVSFVENFPSANAKVEIYKINPATGFRISSTPDQTFVADADGYWGPMPADPTAYYEFKVYTGKPGDRPLHYYREPFTHSDNLVYLRTYPPASSILSLALGIIPKDNNQAVSIFFSGSKALWLGRDDLKINGVSLTNNTFMKKELHTLAIFLYDNNNNNLSDATSVPLFTGFPSLMGADFYFPTASPESTTFDFNGRILKTRNWPSSDEGVSVALYE
jgi:pimeloyl-ACP methyl ester carboxylesterase